MATHSSILAWEIPWTEEPGIHGVTNSWTGLSVPVCTHTHTELINNVVIVSDEQQRDSAIHIHVSILPLNSPSPAPCWLPHNSEQSSLCYTVGPCWLSILNIAVCT